ncbi:MAG TPA: hypothetical protein VKI01_06715, partial [Acidimicrobiia bacterium]|nr:hypothetical protein [Acidimicrobiia bacterium]
MNRGRLLLTTAVVAGIVGGLAMAGSIRARAESDPGGTTLTQGADPTTTSTAPGGPIVPDTNSPTPQPTQTSRAPTAGTPAAQTPPTRTASTPTAPPATTTPQIASVPSIERCQATGVETVRTDRRDYSPGENVEVTGAGYRALCDLLIRVTRPDGSIVVGDGTFQPGSDTVTTDDAGKFLYHYQLDGIAGTYTVDVLGRDDVVLATTTFTDSPPRISAKQHEGQRSDGTYTSGNITQYAEGDSINFRFDLDATQGPAEGDLEVRFTGNDGSCLFFDGSFALGLVEDLGGPQPTVTVDGSPTPVDFGTSSGEWVQRLHIAYPAAFDNEANSARVNYTLKLSNEAGQCSGSSQHSRLNPAGGDVQQSGAQKVPVPANQIIINTATLTVIKHVVNDNGGTAQASDFTMSVTGTNPNPASFSGTESGTDVVLQPGSYSVSESGPPGYARSSSSACSGSIAAGGHATCTITNDDQPARLTLVKRVVNDNGGTAAATDFSLSAAGPTPISGPGGADGAVNAGSYVL